MQNLGSSPLAGLNRAALATALGQYWDSLNPADEAGYWRVVETKSAPFFGAALHAGALLGRADGEVAAQFERLGRLYGEIIQIHDDLHDSLAVPANADWTMGRAPLPILFAQIVQHPDRERFLELRRAIPDPDALAQAQAILIGSGAVSYGIHALLIRHETARDLLAAMPLRRREEVDELLERQVEPVRELFRAIGASPDAIGPTPPELPA